MTTVALDADQFGAIIAAAGLILLCLSALLVLGFRSRG